MTILRAFHSCQHFRELNANDSKEVLVGAVRGKNRGLGEQLDKSMKLFPVDLWVIYLSSGGGPKKSTV